MVWLFLLGGFAVEVKLATLYPQHPHVLVAMIVLGVPMCIACVTGNGPKK